VFLVFFLSLSLLQKKSINFFQREKKIGTFFLSLALSFPSSLLFFSSEQLVDPRGQLPDVSPPGVRPQPGRQRARRLHKVLGLERERGWGETLREGEFFF